MNADAENVKQAKENFNRVLNNPKYAGIIKDDSHLSLLSGLVNGGRYDKIVDIGTGTGYLAFPLAEQFPTASVCGIDIADVMIEKNNAIVRKMGIPNLSFQAFDGIKYPFSDESVDLIVTRYALHHFPNIANAIQQMHKMLVKGGKVLVSDPMRDEDDEYRIIDNFMRVKKDGHILFYSSNELDELFANNGFAKEKQVISELKFPFAKQAEYIKLFDRTTDKEKSIYHLINDHGVIWVKHMKVGNTIFVKQ